MRMSIQCKNIVKEKYGVPHILHFVDKTNQCAKVLSELCLSCVSWLLSQSEILVDTSYRKSSVNDVPGLVDVDELQSNRKTS
jgi:hypothetical protein